MENVKNSIKKHLLALKSLYKGYAMTLKKRGLIEQVKLIENEYENYEEKMNGMPWSIKESIQTINAELAKKGLVGIDLEEYELDL